MKEREILGVRNMETSFRKGCKNYFIKDNKLYYKRAIKIKNQKNKWDIIKVDFYVPTVAELNSLLYKYHVKNCHSNYKELKEEFYKNKIGFIGIDLLLQEYVTNCPVCCQNSHNSKRNDPVKSINIDGPDYRYVFDITYLNDDMAKSFGIKYLLSILDAFSRKGMIYGTNSKKSDNLLKHIIEFCMNNKIPKEFLSDNGAEFKNKYINDFCNMYNIKFIHSSSYSPHSQGIIERFNYTIKKKFS